MAGISRVPRLFAHGKTPVEVSYESNRVNPVPTFLPYEMATSQPIGDTLLDAFAETSMQATTVL